MKLALAGVPPPGGAIWKSLVKLLTAPVGREPGMVTVCGLALRTTGAPLTSPRTSWVVLVPLLTIQKGLLADAVIPHGFTISGSRIAARPGASEIRFVCR